MNEVQEKPKKKWYRIRLSIILIAAISLFFFWLFLTYLTGTHHCPTRYDAYHSNKDEVQNAINNYSESHDESFPTLSGTYTNANCSNCSVINISALLNTNGGLLGGVPDGTHLGNISGADNCNAIEGIGCEDFFSYIWTVDKNGDVYSYCIGSECSTNNSGYQNVWP